MKVLIIALDGLEFDIVKRYELRNLRQKVYGKIELNNFKKISTPFIWASFITGLPPEKHGVDSMRHWRSPLLQYARKLSVKLGLRRVKGKGRIAEMLGARKTYFTSEYYRKKKLETIFDLAENPLIINMPTWNAEDGYGTPKAINELSRRFLTTKNDDLERRLWEEIWDNFNRQHERNLKLIGEHNESDLIAVYYHTLDTIGHLWCGVEEKVEEAYMRFDEAVYQLKKAAGNCFALVVSDHGMKPVGRYGIHSEHAFYSMNINITLEKPRIFDFKPLISLALKAENLEGLEDLWNRQVVLKKLSALGYW